MIKDRQKRRRKTNKPYSSMSYTTGDIGLNINHFNNVAGTGESLNIGSSLNEAKRYVRRYYVRPQNIFCSNKQDILKTLIDIGDQNCTIYTLNNLGDEKDVSKLMNSDIIYYYDDGILSDKNHVKIFDYDLSIKKEEERKKFANVDKASEKEFKAEYEDRMTDATELEEDVDLDSLMHAFDDCDYDVVEAGYTHKGSIIITLNHGVPDVYTAAEHLLSQLQNCGIIIKNWNTNGSNVFIFEPDIDNAFDLEFESYNAFGECLTESKEDFCCICGEPIEGYGNNPEPYKSSEKGKACDSCNIKFVIPMRLAKSKED